MEKIYLGIDVGTNSVRVGAFNQKGTMRGKGEHPIRVWRPQTDFVEQSHQGVKSFFDVCFPSCHIQLFNVNGSSLRLTHVLFLLLNTKCHLPE